MSIENVKKFYECVAQDEAVKQKFAELAQKYQSEALDADKVAVVFEQEVLPLAAQIGYPFSLDDLKACGEEMQQANMNRELSDGEMEAVTGGGLISVIVGLNEGTVTGTDVSHGMCGFLGFNNTGGFCFIIGAGTK